MERIAGRGIRMITAERIDRLLPIGSVVMLKGAQKALMIYGVCQTDEKTGEDYDYIGVLCPEGSIGADTQFLFNHADVEKTIFTGYDAPERAGFIKALKAFYAKKNL